MVETTPDKTPRIKPRLGLAMMVKNESAVIERCLQTVKPWIDHWTIVDTGSDDDTPQRIQACMQGIPGQLHHLPWRGWQHSRNNSLDLAWPHTQYVLMIDADEMLHVQDPAWRESLQGPGYELRFRRAEFDYWRKCLFSTDYVWQYQGVVHEYAVCAQPQGFAPFDGAWVLSPPEGARSQNPRKYEEDALLLEQALQQEPDNARYWYYLGQSWRDCQEWERCIHAYQRSAALSAWPEERWHAIYNIAKAREASQQSLEQVQSAYLHAYNIRPSRAEPLLRLAEYSILHQAYPQALLFAQQAVHMPCPPDLLFIEHQCYGWYAHDVLARALCANHLWQEAHAVFSAMLLRKDLPPTEQARVQQNLVQIAKAGSILR